LIWGLSCALWVSIEDGLHVSQNSDLIDEESKNAEASAEDFFKVCQLANGFGNVGGMHGQHEPECQSEVAIFAFSWVVDEQEIGSEGKTASNNG
jgi:hypothetical protein